MKSESVFARPMSIRCGVGLNCFFFRSEDHHIEDTGSRNYQHVVNSGLSFTQAVKPNSWGVLSPIVLILYYNVTSVVPDYHSRIISQQKKAVYSSWCDVRRCSLSRY